MSDYAFYADMIRFIVRKTDQVDDRVAAMMAALVAAADAVEKEGAFTVPADRLELTARAFAGVAAFLQKQILPEAVAHGHGDAEMQVRWAVDAAMEAVNLLLTRAALLEGQPVEVRLPAPPRRT